MKISETTYSRNGGGVQEKMVCTSIFSVNAKIAKNELPAILEHELGVHLRRYLAGKTSGLKIFETGVGYYLRDEEGLAVYKSFQKLPDNYEKNAMFF